MLLNFFRLNKNCGVITSPKNINMPFFVGKLNSCMFIDFQQYHKILNERIDVNSLQSVITIVLGLKKYYAKL